jgi:hypothetical protein
MGDAFCAQSCREKNKEMKTGVSRIFFIEVGFENNYKGSNSNQYHEMTFVTF